MNNKNLVKGTLLLLGILGIIFTSKTSAFAEIITGMDGTIVTLTVCGHDYNSDTDGCITMMDRNLGADAYMGEDGKTADDWNGYYYQWGDNTLYTDTDWSSSNIKFDNARGGGSDNELKYPINNDSERRGPCPEGYHVPSQGEWYALMDIYFEKAVNGSGFHKNVGRFSQAFKIPFAGRRYIDDSIQEFQYGIGYLWLSSSILGSEESWSFYMDSDVTSKMSISANNRAYGFPVRCFKDSSVTSPSSEDGNSLITVNIAALNSGQNTCSGEDYIFPNISALPTVQTISLAKRFSCVFGNAAAKAVTLQLSGDLKDGNGNVISGENVKLSNPEWTATPVVLKNGNTYFSGQTFLGIGQTLFNKVASKIGEAYGSGVEIKITIPAGTPDGLYEGTLVLTY